MSFELRLSGVTPEFGGSVILVYELSRGVQEALGDFNGNIEVESRFESVERLNVNCGVVHGCLIRCSRW
jgi:hypothetical protein